MLDLKHWMHKLYANDKMFVLYILGDLCNIDGGKIMF